MKLFKRLNHKGISLIEAVASNIIIALVIITTMSIIINLRLQSAIAEERYRAYTDADISRSQMIDRLTYVDLQAAIETSLGRAMVNGDVYVLTDTAAQTTCPTNFPCTYMYDINGHDYPTTVTFTVQSTTLKLIDFDISIQYFQTRTLVVEGMIYG